MRLRASVSASGARRIELARHAQRALDPFRFHHRSRHPHRAEQRGARQLIEGEYGGVLEPELVLQPGGRIAEAVRGAQRGGARVGIRGGEERHRARRAAADEQAEGRGVYALLVEQAGGRFVGQRIGTLLDRDVHALEAESFQHGRRGLERSRRGELADRARRRRVRVGDSADAERAVSLDAGRGGLHATLHAMDAQKGAGPRYRRGSGAVRRNAGRTT